MTPMTNNDYFVPNGTFDSREETATALVGAADEFHLSQRAIRTAQGGFWISEELANAVFNDVDQTDTIVEDGDKTVDDGDKDNSDSSENKTPEDDQSSEEQTDKAPAKKSRSKK